MENNKIQHHLANKLYNKKKYNDSIVIYTDLINKNYKKDIIYSNRAACYLQLQKYLESLNDSLKAVELNINYSLAWGRIGYSYKGLKMHSHAYKAFDIAHNLDKKNKIYSNENNFYYNRLSKKLNFGVLFKIMINNKDLYHELIELKKNLLNINNENFLQNKIVLDYADKLLLEL